MITKIPNTIPDPHFSLTTSEILLKVINIPIIFLRNFSKMNTKSAEEWGGIYKASYDKYKSFTNELNKLIIHLLKNDKLEIAQIEHRTKDIDSFIGKIKRKEKNYINPIAEVTDLVGIRIITYYSEDIDKIGKLLKKEFKIDYVNSINKSQAIEPDKFGYLSVHFIICLGDNRKNLTEWKMFSDINAEIQVRTVLQHAWAAIDHKLIYKSAIDVPKELSRKLFRLSALLELADEQFLELRNITENLENDYTNKALLGNFDFGINLNSLEIYFNFTNQLKIWANLAKEIGFMPLEQYKIDTKITGNVISLQRIIKIMNLLGKKTVKEFDDILNNIQDGKQSLRYFMSKTQGQINYLVIHPLQIIILFLTHLFRKELSKEQLMTIGFSKNAFSIIEQMLIE